MTSYQGIGSNKSCICQENSRMNSILNKAGFFIKKFFFEKLLIDMVMAPLHLTKWNQSCHDFSSSKNQNNSVNRPSSFFIVDHLFTRISPYWLHSLGNQPINASLVCHFFLWSDSMLEHLLTPPSSFACDFTTYLLFYFPTKIHINNDLHSSFLTQIFKC